MLYIFTFFVVVVLTAVLCFLSWYGSACFLQKPLSFILFYFCIPQLKKNDPLSFVFLFVVTGPAEPPPTAAERLRGWPPGGR